MSFLGGLLGGAAIGAIGNILGGSISANKSANSAKEALEAQKEAMQNRHQWQVADLRKAGLNPILSANNGASTGGLNMPMPDYSGLQSGISSAAQLFQQLADLRLKDAGVKKIEAETNKTNEEALTNVALGNMYRTQALINNSNANMVLRRDEWLRKNPEWFDVMMKREAIPAQGGLFVGGLDFLNQAIQHTARNLQTSRSSGD